MVQEKYVLVYHSEGEYEDTECIHDFIAVFPHDATEEEIRLSLEQEKKKYKSAKNLAGCELINYDFQVLDTFFYAPAQTVRTFTKVVE